MRITDHKEMLAKISEMLIGFSILFQGKIPKEKIDDIIYMAGILTDVIVYIDGVEKTPQTKEQQQQTQEYKIIASNDEGTFALMINVAMREGFVLSPHQPSSPYVGYCIHLIKYTSK